MFYVNLSYLKKFTEQIVMIIKSEIDSYSFISNKFNIYFKGYHK